MWDLILFEITGRDAVLFCLKFQMIYHGKNFYEFPIHLTIYGPVSYTHLTLPTIYSV